MKHAKWIILGWVLVASAATPLWSAQGDAGTNSPFELGAGSRALALAGAFVPVANDVTALFWNPGGLALLEQTEVSAMHINLFFDTPYDFIGVAYPLLDWGTFSVGAVRIATEGIILRDERAQTLGSGSGSLDLREYLFGFGREVYANIRAGVVVKLDQQRLVGDFDNGVGLDLGFHYIFPKDLTGGFAWENLSAGLTFQNLMGAQLRLNRMTDVLPTHMRAGMAYNYRMQDSLKQSILVSVVWDKSTWRSSHFSAGLEYTLLNLFALRGGVNTSAWTVGGGVQYSGIFLDYSLAGEELGMTHRFSLSYRFGTPLSEQRTEQEKKQLADVEAKAEKRAKAAVDKAKKDLDKALQAAERRHSKEKTDLVADLRAEQKQLLDTERQRQQEEMKAAVADEYFKAYHYFQGIKDYMAQKYQQALIEFQTVEKYDPNYLELQIYLARTKQRIKGKIEFMTPENMMLYYQGIDMYVAEKFEDAIATWEKILKTEPNNLLVLRNIDEAKERIAKLKAVRKLVEDEQKQPGTQTAPSENVPVKNETVPKTK